MRSDSIARLLVDDRPHVGFELRRIADPQLGHRARKVGQVVEYRAKTWKQYRPTVPVTSSSVKNTSPMTAGMAYRGGEKVRHPKFGEGQVLAVAGMGDKQEVTVHFPTAGTKKLLVKFANLSAV